MCLLCFVCGVQITCNLLLPLNTELRVPAFAMLGFASRTINGTLGWRKSVMNSTKHASDCSDDEPALSIEGLECPICWESFNIVENVPFVLWCGHTLCKNCVLGLQRAVMKLPTLPIQLPFFIACPWCNLLSLRLVYKGNLSFPRKNYVLLWIVESMNGDRSKSRCSNHHQPVASMKRSSSSRNHRAEHQRPITTHDNARLSRRYIDTERLRSSMHKLLVFLMHFMAKFPLIIVLLLIVLYAIPASAAILALYALITLIFAVPSFLILYFAFPSLDWLVREIAT